MTSLLLVDDEASVRESLGEYLSQQGYQLDTAASVPEALALTSQKRHDLIVSDLKLGSQSGLSLKQEVRRRFGEMEPAFVLMTGHASLDSAIEALNLGVDQLLLKPLKLSDLSAAIDSGLKRRKTAAPSLKVHFSLAEQFYHDLSLPLNQLIPRLCMLLEGRHGSLSMAQSRNISAQLDSLRRVLWLMKGFYPRLLEGQINPLRRQPTGLSGLFRSVLSKLEEELQQRRVTLAQGNLDELRPAWVVPETVAQFLEILLLRALAIAEPGSTLQCLWESYPESSELKIALKFPGHSGPASPIAALMPLVPVAQSCLEDAGFTFESEGPAGPWTLRFSLSNG